ncbi:protein MCM10 homolog [Microplitis demolitor]|uniref:protein MCM10 homolog n=1 Tax=Microplitis demolitor TaxID=69319 RepID=UPI0004CDD662|nr:protein MCM10 homolog [Microplitis demolitor]
MSDDSDVGDLLEDLLANDEEAPKKVIKELDFNFLDSVEEQSDGQQKVEEKVDKDASKLMHDVDSSDDEDNKYFEERTYSEAGRSIKELLKKQQDDKDHLSGPRSSSSDVNIKEKVYNNTFSRSPRADSKSQAGVGAGNKVKEGPIKEWLKKPSDIYTDPIFGLRIVKPLISSNELAERMKGRAAVTVSKVKNFITTQDLNNDWVIAGVLIQRSATKKSQNGNAYCIWTISDLTENVNRVTVFLFKGAYKTFWKVTDGVVVGILNPSVLEARNDKDEAALSVDNAQKIMILGNSKDLGRCKSVKKNGDPCNAIVNVNRCEYCIYHVKTEYNKASRRQDLQTDHMNRKFGTNFGSKNNLNAGSKGSGMYSQANHHTNMLVVPAKRNLKMEQKDSERLALLTGTGKTSNPGPGDSKPGGTGLGLGLGTGPAETVESASKIKNTDRLQKIRDWNPKTSNLIAGVLSPLRPTSIAEKVTTPKCTLSPLPPIPRLGSGLKGSTIDFSEPITKKHINKAKRNAIEWVKSNGGFKQSNPNKIAASREKKVAASKRTREEPEDPEPAAKKAAKERFKELMEKTSAHGDLIERSQENEQEKYFNKLEAKERMEEKMIKTFKVDCKAVKCLICKYTSFSASDLCKTQKHPLRVIDAVKSFFKCGDCGNRTVSLDRIPSVTCNKCSGSSWLRTGMMDEKKVGLARDKLSIRGGEQKFIGGDITDTSLSLLVPDTD